MKTLVAILLAAAVAGCASSSGVVPNGGGTFNITKQQATGFPGIGNMKAEVHQEAAAYCAGQKRDFEVLRYFETPGPYILGNYPRVDLIFKCV